MYEIILFDLDDTLLDFASSERESLKRIHADFYTELDFPVFFENFTFINRELWKKVTVPSNPLKPSEIRLRRFIEFNQKFNIQQDHEIIAGHYEKHLGETADWLPGVKGAIELLHQKGYTLGIVTNGLANVQNKKYELQNLENWFQCFIVSDKVNVTKPHKDIFEIAFSELRAEKNLEKIDLKKVLMVGDSLHADGQGSKNIGIDFCFIGQGNPEEIKKTHGIPIKYSISSVSELPACLG